MAAKRKKPDARAAPHDAVRFTEAIDYKLQAYSYEQIAAHMKISVAQAVAFVHAELAALIREPSDAQMLLDLQRIDQMIAAIYPAASRGDFQAINTFLALRKERETLEKTFARAESFRVLAAPDGDDACDDQDAEP